MNVFGNKIYYFETNKIRQYDIKYKTKQIYRHGDCHHRYLIANKAILYINDDIIVISEASVIKFKNIA